MSRVTIELSLAEAKRLLDSLSTTAMIAGDCALPGDEGEDDESEGQAIDNVDRFIGQLRRQLEEVA